MNNLFDSENVELVAELPTTNLVISTSMFEIHFKQTQKGDTAINAGRGVLPINIINSIADQHIQQMARLIYDIQAAVEGLDAIGSGNVSKPSTYFKDGAMKDKYRAMCTEAQVIRAERLWAEFLAHWSALQELIKERTQKVVAKAPMQFGYVGFMGREHGFPMGPLLDLNEALRYRVLTYTRRLLAQRNYEDKMHGKPSAVSVSNVIAA